MQYSLSKRLEALARGISELEQVGQNPDSAQALAQALRTACPFAHLCLCRLHLPPEPSQVVTIRQESDPEESDPFFPEGLFNDLPNEIRQVAGPDGLTYLIRGLQPPSKNASGDLLGLLISHRGDPAPACWALEIFAQAAALHLHCVRLNRQVEAWRRMPETRDRLADLGLLAGPISHEFSNFLNVALLQVALLEPTMQGESLEDLRSLRRQGRAIASLLQDWQQSRQRSQGSEPTHRIDINATLQAAVDSLWPTRSTPWPEFQLDPQIPWIEANQEELFRIFRFLLRNSLGAGAHRVVIQTQALEDGIQIRIEDDGSPITEGPPQQFFDPPGPRREGTIRLEILSCKSLVQRKFHGEVWAENNPAGGLIVILKLPC